MKLVNLIPLKEIDFKNQDQFDAYSKEHELRPATKVTIAGKVTTAGQASQKTTTVKGTSVFGKSAGAAKEKSITSIKTDAQVDVSMVSKSILPNLRVADGSGYPDKDAVELKKRLDNGDSGVYTRTSDHGGNIVFKDGTRFQVFRPHDAHKTKATTIYASKR
jgi:hypothetical protein